VGKAVRVEGKEESGDGGGRGGQEVVRQNEPHPWREARKADHRPDLAAQMGRRAPINTGLWARALPRAVMAGTNQSPHSGTIMVNADDRLRRIACDRHTSMMPFARGGRTAACPRGAIGRKFVAMAAHEGQLGRLVVRAYLVALAVTLGGCSASEVVQNLPPAGAIDLPQPNYRP